MVSGLGGVNGHFGARMRAWHSTVISHNGTLDKPLSDFHCESSQAVRFFCLACRCLADCRVLRDVKFRGILSGDDVAVPAQLLDQAIRGLLIPAS